MREQMEARLKALKSELKAGEAELARVEHQRTYLGETLLRISGAVQVIEELLAEGQPTEQRDGTNLADSRSEDSGTRAAGVRAADSERASWRDSG